MSVYTPLSKHELENFLQQYDLGKLKSSGYTMSYDNGAYTGAKYVNFLYTSRLKKDFNCYWQDIGTLSGLKKARKHYEKTHPMS